MIPKKPSPGLGPVGTGFRIGSCAKETGKPMPYETILTALSENIFTITINRPDTLNALNLTMIRELLDAFDKADADDEVRAIIVTGAGRAFCAGADLSLGGKTFDRHARADRPPVPDG